ncbi:serine/threonine-protein kinase [Streptomyces peucetius]|uniref:non-specific serine/threonine protein kinase n=1 Tax=Streptomyces peucetius TaxID=1950 RepID=A0ABY6IK87_STRPE|nr:serine/threonine-protein kinase [Streptomyces peucetius]UYQ66115.1 serine/threonine protein kinase [Streptomyces peucetius]
MNTWSVPGYTESRELGSGGCGRVVLAVHDATGVPVAVKYLNERLRADTGFVREFRAEAQLLGGLDSPYVVRLHEYVESPQGAAIVMELVDGVALRALLLREGATGPEAALAVLKGSLLGLAAAHGAGVVHRDYKPENVLVAVDGSSKLVDFGIAAGRGTTPGVAGTPAYMAPEQWHGEPASPAADVYAATATFYECLTGHKPFRGENIAELALQHIGAPVPEDDAPEPVRPLIRRGLAKSPGRRPANAAAFVAELEEIAGAAYGPDWEERGQRRLAALAALLPLLLPSGGRAAEAADTATTAIGEGTGEGAGIGTGAHPAGRLPPALRKALAGAAALAVAAAIAVSARAGEGGSPETAARAVATTSALPSGGGAPSTEAGGTTGAPGPADSPAPASPPASASADTGPSAPSPATSATSATSATPTESAAPPSVPPSQPPARPVSSPPPTVVPVRVKSVDVTGFRQTGTATAAATVEVVTDGTGPVTITVSWSTGDVKGEPGAAESTESFERSGATGYTLALDHTYQGTGCYWTVRASTGPAAASGVSTRQLLTRRGCPIP